MNKTNSLFNFFRRTPKLHTPTHLNHTRSHSAVGAAVYFHILSVTSIVDLPVCPSTTPTHSNTLKPYPTIFGETDNSTSNMARTKQTPQRNAGDELKALISQIHGDAAIEKQAFYQAVKGILAEKGLKVKFQSSALAMLLAGAEAHVSELLGDATVHKEDNDLTCQDLRLAKRLRGM